MTFPPPPVFITAADEPVLAETRELLEAVNALDRDAVAVAVEFEIHNDDDDNDDDDNDDDGLV